MLDKKQKALREEIAELEKSIDYIDWKQNFYDDVLSGKRPYVSNLILRMRMNSKVELYPFVDVGTHLCAGFFSCPNAGYN